jgi:hypothetical protein
VSLRNAQLPAMLLMRDALSQPVTQLRLRPCGVLSREPKRGLLQLLHEVNTAPITTLHFFGRRTDDVATLYEPRQIFGAAPGNAPVWALWGKSAGTMCLILLRPQVSRQKPGVRQARSDDSDSAPLHMLYLLFIWMLKEQNCK